MLSALVPALAPISRGNALVMHTCYCVPACSALGGSPMWSSWTTSRVSSLSSPTPAPTLLEWPCQEQPGSGFTASALESDVSSPA